MIVISTTFRDFDGTLNDKMQVGFLNSLRRQTFQDFILVVTIFNEKKVKKIVRKILGNKAVFVHDKGSEQYRFSLSKAFMNGVDYGLANSARVLVDCSSDILLQKNFLDIVNKRTGSYAAGISHPNIFCEKDQSGKRTYHCGKIHQGIDIRFYSFDLFQNTHIYNILNRFPSYDYGAGIEIILCGIAIKYAKRRYNIFMESKVLKEANVRDIQSETGSGAMQEEAKRNVLIAMRFIRSEHIRWKYANLLEMNRAYKVTKSVWLYWMWFGREIIDFYIRQSFIEK